MPRYQSSKIITTPQSPIKRLQNMKYPQIPLGINDTYVYTTRGDRYDTLAETYYGDSSYWWIIAMANITNTTPDSIIPEIGSQTRIPSVSAIPNIIANYESINKYR